MPTNGITSKSEINTTNAMIAEACKLCLQALADAEKISKSKRKKALKQAMHNLDFEYGHTLHNCDFSPAGMEKLYQEMRKTAQSMRDYAAANPDCGFIDPKLDARSFEQFSQDTIAKSLINLAISGTELILEIQGDFYNDPSEKLDYRDDLIFQFIDLATDGTAENFEYIRKHEILSDYYDFPANDQCADIWL